MLSLFPDLIQDLQLVNETTDHQLLRLTNIQADLDQQALENEADTPLTLSNLQPSLAAIDGVPSFGHHFTDHQSYSPQPSINSNINNPLNNSSSQYVSTTSSVFSSHQSSPFSQQQIRSTVAAASTDTSSTSRQAFSCNSNINQQSSD